MKDEIHQRDIGVPPMRATHRTGETPVSRQRISSLLLLPSSLALLAAAVELWPGATNWLQLDRTAFFNYEVWRLFTCHFTHFGLNHLLWDVSVFLLLGWICQRIDRRGFLMATISSIILIPLGVLALAPSIQTYRGLSGIDSALFGFLCVSMIQDNVGQKNRIGVIFSVALLIAFAMKIAIEMHFGATVFADNFSEHYTPLPLAHLIGLMTGAVICGVWSAHWVGVRPDAGVISRTPLAAIAAVADTMPGYGFPQHRARSDGWNRHRGE
jgi:rhomboid family GlyGly-CTERM serine protease